MMNDNVDQLVCRWCSREFTARKTGGWPQKFCCCVCRQAYHSARRALATEKLETGELSVEDLKGATATCTLLRTRF